MRCWLIIFNLTLDIMIYVMSDRPIQSKSRFLCFFKIYSGSTPSLSSYNNRAKNFALSSMDSSIGKLQGY